MVEDEGKVRKLKIRLLARLWEISDAMEVRRCYGDWTPGERSTLMRAVGRVADRIRKRHPERFAMPVHAKDGPAHGRLRTRVASEDWPDE